MSNLAILGGEPVRTRPWPTWPRADAGTEQVLLDVLHSGRWAISGLYNGQPLYERRFAEAFACYHNVPYCVPTNNGSSALVAALEVLGVGYGDEVLVPGVTWVACASAVSRIGAIPILVDVEHDTLCMSPEAARAAITPRTKAIMLVHLYCSMVDIDAFQALSSDFGIPLVEDCSQAHGAQWRGEKVGTFGAIGVFSMQDSKVLTCGEGGAAITRDPRLYELLQQVRADGRRFTRTAPAPGQLELEEIGEIQGYNFCLSEFQSAILLDRLPHLDGENRHRHENAEYLRSLLLDVGGVQPLNKPAPADSVTYYQFCVRLDLDEFGGLDLEVIRCALIEELGLLVEAIDSPLNNNLLYNPLHSPRTNFTDGSDARLDPRRFHLPVSEQAKRECLTFHHRALLGDRSDMQDIAAAFEKVKRHHAELVAS